MITEVELVELVNQAVHSFLLEEIERKSLARKIAEVKIFAKGSKIVIERAGKSSVKIEPKQLVSKAMIRKEYILNSDFDMIRAFFQTLATKMANQESKAIIKEMKDHAGLHVDAKGDILGGLIEAAKQLRKHGHDPKGRACLIISQKTAIELEKALKRDPKRAKLLRKLLSK